MKEWILMCLAASVIPIQAIVNGRLGMAVMNPFLAALISFFGGCVALAVITVVHSRGIPHLPEGAQIPWYLLTGGLLGGVFVTSMIVLVPKLGPTNAISAAIIGQLVTGLILDHFGALGMTVHPISLVRVAGVVLLLLGGVMIQRG